MTAMKRQKYRKEKQTKRKHLQTLCDMKVEQKKARRLTKTAVMLPRTLKRNASRINDETYKMI